MSRSSTLPTVVLIHGAFAESASWNGVISRLHRENLRAVAVANPLRSLTGDSAFLADILDSIEGPVVLVGHSYGGSVMSNAAQGKENVKALVFVAAFAPATGESIGELSGMFPGGTLGDTLEHVPLADGGTDFYIKQNLYHQQFTADVAPADAELNAVTQRPLRDAALNEASGPPAWRTIPSWFVFPELDHNIPLAAHRFMAERAGARQTVEVPGASHALPVSRPDTVADIVLHAVAHVSASSGSRLSGMPA